MTDSRRSYFGAATFASAAVVLLYLAVSSAWPSRPAPMPDWGWLAVGAGFLLCLALLAIPGLARKIAAGVLIAIASPVVLILTLLVVGGIGKAIGSIFT